MAEEKRKKTYILKENINEVMDMRSKGLTDEAIAREFSDRYDAKFDRKEVSMAVTKEKALAISYGSDKMKEQADKVLGDINKRYDDAVKMVDWLVDSITKIKGSLVGLPPEEEAIKFIKLAPLIIQTSREIINQLGYIKKEQEQIKVEQNNLILSPIQVNIQMTKKLKEWAEKGYVKVLKVVPEFKDFGVTYEHEEDMSEDDEINEKEVQN